MCLSFLVTLQITFRFAFKLSLKVRNRECVGGKSEKCWRERDKEKTIGKEKVCIEIVARTRRARFSARVEF